MHEKPFGIIEAERRETVIGPLEGKIRGDPSVPPTTEADKGVGHLCVSYLACNNTKLARTCNALVPAMYSNLSKSCLALLAAAK